MKADVICFYSGIFIQDLEKTFKETMVDHVRTCHFQLVKSLKIGGMGSVSQEWNWGSGGAP